MNFLTGIGFTSARSFAYAMGQRRSYTFHVARLPIHEPIGWHACPTCLSWIPSA
jgi:hypothetical protein